ncbi:MAG: SLC13 family permease, partial [Acidimicrobiia bacterium]|nr:SLC13 family permease [Acidimicrobiia bacterium]
MTWDIAFVFGLTIVALLLFTWERVRIDATAVFVMVVLMVSGLLTPEESLAGFSNIATVTVAAMFVLSAGIRQTGALSSVGDLLARLGGRSRWLALGALIGVVGVVSGFINNTAAVALLIPVVVGLGRDLGTSPSKLLMPLSFASMFGGVATLIGTSTNLLVNAIAVDRGFDEFGLFELTPLGVVLFAVGAGYLFVAFRFIPDRREGSGQDLTERFEMTPFLTQVRIDASAVVVGETVGDNALVRDLQVDIIDVERESQVRSGADRDLELSAGDVLRVRTPATDVARLLAYEGVSLVPPTGGDRLDSEVETETETLVEAVIAPNSQLAGRTVDEVNFPGRHGAQVLALRQHGELERGLADAVLHAGNSLLLKIDREALAELQADE